jgi:hypothetical protein
LPIFGDRFPDYLLSHQIGKVLPTAPTQFVEAAGIRFG